jgi:hypothetical protein
MLALEREWAGLGPGLHDQVVRLLEALVGEERIDAGRMVFVADAAHETGDDAAARQVVEHRELFGDVNRVVHQRQRAADDGDLGLAGARDQVGRDQIWRRHQAVGGLVVLVHRDDVEAELLRVDQLVDVGLVFVGALLWIVQRVRQHHPSGAMLMALGHVERAIGHQVEKGELHDSSSARSVRRISSR